MAFVGSHNLGYLVVIQVEGNDSNKVKAKEAFQSRKAKMTIFFNDSRLHSHSVYSRIVL